MLNNKKAQIPVIKILLILLFTTVILLSWTFILLDYQKISIDDKNLRTQILLNKINDKCFSSEYGKIVKNNFNSDILDECVKGINEKTNIRLFSSGIEIYAQNQEAKFKNLANLCTSKSTLKCTEMKYPVYIIDNSNSQKLDTLKVQIIVT